MINRLIEIISKEAALFETFLHLLQKQKEMLVSNDLTGLTDVTRQQQQKLMESRELNRQREDLVEAIKAANAIEGDLTVSRLLDLVDQAQADRLLHLRDVIVGINDQITAARNTNAMLVNQSREFIARTMAALAKINSPGGTYAPSGMESGDGNVVVDRRA